jgi:hypothetical protein
MRVEGLGLTLLPANMPVNRTIRTAHLPLKPIDPHLRRYFRRGANLSVLDRPLNAGGGGWALKADDSGP